MASTKILPGSIFPTISLPNGNGSGNLSLNSENGRHKLVVVYRGQFCPFCAGSLKEIQAKSEQVNAAGIDIVAVSADDVETSSKFIATNGFTIPIASNLTVNMMRQLGLFVSSPIGYIDQAHVFAEPGYFLITPKNDIRYMTISSSPVGGRVDIDTVLMGFAFNKSKGPEFEAYRWGNQ
mmetsp:Transcript_15335/g.14713  ORF Transcript_15335/g.14713 Transcript_15335/m.14713 type:complete len:179 (+) Transcript_15335:162-698(+)